MASWPAVCPNPRKWDPRAGRHWSHRYDRRPATAGRLHFWEHFASRKSQVAGTESLSIRERTIRQSAQSRVASAPNRFRSENETLRQLGGEPLRAAQQTWLHLAVSNPFTVLFRPERPRPQVLRA